MSVTKTDPDLCPHCKVKMEALPAGSAPDAVQAPQAGGVVRQYACPVCHHVEGRLHRT